jgi:hypothetical protein
MCPRANCDTARPQQAPPRLGSSGRIIRPFGHIMYDIGGSSGSGMSLSRLSSIRTP